MNRLAIVLAAFAISFFLSQEVNAASQYKIVHKDQVAEEWEVHLDYPLFEELKNKGLQERVNQQIVQKLEDTFRRVKSGAGETMGEPFLYYEETSVYQEGQFYSVVMTSHITRGNRYNSTVTSINFEDQNGESVMSLKDLVHIDRLNTEVKKVVTSDPDMYVKEPFAGVRDNTAFYIKDDCIVLVFNKFEIAAGVHGTPEIPIALDGLLKEEINQPHVPFPSYTKSSLQRGGSNLS
ncbi:DUF3298 and DUF4163 domain-containing protein [Halobacillus litoralis]|uniref:DUF3298 and DUF4163 domain-containing protein n=1 Tax=Halobacillus litoralis TaxID=45668 RepID=UPI001CFDE02F|nr:DUF3298 and DUF4163 domain-containing protein [Halobacillus litoralis]